MFRCFSSETSLKRLGFKLKLSIVLHVQFVNIKGVNT